MAGSCGLMLTSPGSSRSSNLTSHNPTLEIIHLRSQTCMNRNWRVTLCGQRLALMRRFLLCERSLLSLAVFELWLIPLCADWKCLTYVIGFAPGHARSCGWCHVDKSFLKR